MAKDTKMTCGMGMCGKCHGGKNLVAGLVLLGATMYTTWNPWTVVGALMVLGGLAKMAWPSCGHCK